MFYISHLSYRYHFFFIIAILLVIVSIGTTARFGSFCIISFSVWAVGRFITVISDLTV